MALASAIGNWYMPDKPKYTLLMVATPAGAGIITPKVENTRVDKAPLRPKNWVKSKAISMQKVINK